MSAIPQEIDHATRYAPHRPAGKEALVLAHADLVRRIARQMIRRMPGNVELDDLIQAGMVGLLEAAERYAGHESASFATFSTHRIRGAMLDSLRECDWGPRSLRGRLRDIERVQRRIEIRTCKRAKPPAIADALGVTLATYFETMRESSLSHLLSLDQHDASDPSMTCLEPVDGEPRPDEHLEREQAIHAMQSGIDELHRSERAMLELYYDEELLMREIAVIYAMSESRVCQILKRIVGRLRVVTRRTLEGDSRRWKRVSRGVLDAQGR